MAEKTQPDQETSCYAEEAIISSLIIDPTIFDEIGDSLTPLDFCHSFNKEVYFNISEMLASNKKVDLICLCAYIASKKYLGNENDIIKKLSFIKNHFTRSSQNIKSYVDILKSESLDRKLSQAAHEIIKSIQQGEENRLDLAQKRISDIAEQKNVQVFSIAELIPNILQTISERCEKEEPIQGLPTGFIDLDKITNGLSNGDLIIIAARPSMGKTLLSMNIAEHCALKVKKPVIIFSLEMNKEQLIERSLSSTARIKSELIKTGRLTQEEITRIAEYSSNYTQSPYFFIDDKSSSTVSDMRARCRKIKKEYGLSLVVVDYLTLISSNDCENETIRVGKISRELKLLARDLDVPVIVISQLNRGVESRQDKRPNMSDLRSSGAIEQDADLILFIYRDEVYNEATNYKGVAELIVAKHRNGNLGKIYLKFNGDICRFDNHVYRPQNYIVEETPKRTHWQTYT